MLLDDESVDFNFIIEHDARIIKKIEMFNHIHYEQLAHTGKIKMQRIFN